MGSRARAFEHLPPQVIDPIMHLAGQLISLSGYFAVAAIIVVAIRAWLRYQNGADALELWREILIILLLAAVAAQTFDIATWFN
ncbi:hypothetical protein ABH933_001279 [Nocardia sp. GP40]|uniref:hypothetical protein n=1 Tax=Nocardia sp. GP40 TaxID=3156268 RepID=UPI003D1CA165